MPAISTVTSVSSHGTVTSCSISQDSGQCGTTIMIIIVEMILGGTIKGKLHQVTDLSCDKKQLKKVSFEYLDWQELLVVSSRFG